MITLSKEDATKVKSQRLARGLWYGNITQDNFQRYDVVMKLFQSCHFVAKTDQLDKIETLRHVTLIDSCAGGGRVLVFQNVTCRLPGARLKFPGQISDCERG